MFNEVSNKRSIINKADIALLNYDQLRLALRTTKKYIAISEADNEVKLHCTNNLSYLIELVKTKEAVYAEKLDIKSLLLITFSKLSKVKTKVKQQKRKVNKSQKSYSYSYINDELTPKSYFNVSDLTAAKRKVSLIAKRPNVLLYEEDIPIAYKNQFTNGWESISKDYPIYLTNIKVVTRPNNSGNLKDLDFIALLEVNFNGDTVKLEARLNITEFGYSVTWVKNSLLNEPLVKPSELKKYLSYAEKVLVKEKIKFNAKLIENHYKV